MEKEKNYLMKRYLNEKNEFVMRLNEINEQEEFLR